VYFYKTAKGISRRLDSGIMVTLLKAIYVGL